MTERTFREASGSGEHLTPSLTALLDERVAEDDAAEWDEYISLDVDEREVTANRSGMG